MAGGKIPQPYPYNAAWFYIHKLAGWKMAEALQFFKTYEVVVYLALGIGAIIYLRKFSIAWQELRGAIFGLERDSAQNRLIQATGVLVLLVMMAVAEFVLVSFVAPMVPGASPLPTPTIDLLATPTTTLEPGELEGESPQGLATDLPLPTIALDESSCIPDEIMITAPVDEASLTGEVEIRGTADIPDFGFYKIEVARRLEPFWLTIQAGRSPVKEAVLVANWDTSALPAGDYVLQLVVVDSQGNNLPPCRISVRVEVQ
jgi:hypothetical protein